MRKILCMFIVVVLSLTSIITLPVAASDIGSSFVSNLKYLGPTTDGTTTYDGTPVLMDDLQNGKTIYTNYSVINFADVDDFIVGLPYIKIPSPIAGSNPSFVKTAWSGGTTIDWMSFDLSKSAIIRVFTEGKMDSLAQEKYGFKSNLAPATPGYYFQRYNNIANEYNIMNYMYTKEVSVPEGETVTVTLPNALGAAWGYSIVIDATYSDSSFVADSVSFTDGTNAITSVLPNSTIKATTQVQNSGFSGTVMFILAEYTGNRCTKVNIDTKEVANRKTESFQAEVTTGNDVSDVCYKAFIWQSGSINPITNLATFPSNNIQLESMCINGAKLEGFSNLKTEYTYRAYSLGVNDNACPTVTAQAVDNSTKFEVINPTTLPGAITVKVISSVGTIKTFIINCEVHPAITNLKYLGPTTDGTTTYDGTPVLMDDLQNGKTIYTNYSSVLFSKITEDMVGLPYIKIPNPISGLNPSFVKTAWSGGTTIDWMSFDLSKSALVKVFTQGEMNSLTQEKYGFKSNLAPATPGYYFQRHNNISNEYDSMNYMYTKEVSVPEGETVTVTLPNAPGLACWGYSIVVCGN